MKGRPPTLLWLAVLVALFGVGLARLFQLRFEAGDVYAPYSSLRADPLGTKALYQGLKNLPGLAVRRFTQPLDKLPDGRGTTLLVFGAGDAQVASSTRSEYKTLEQFMFDGGRIVISVAPVSAKPWMTRRDEMNQKKEKDQAREAPARKDPDRAGDRKRDTHDKPPVDDGEAGPEMKLVPLKERWNVGLAYEDLPRDDREDYQPVPVRRIADLPLPDSLGWHSALYFESPGTNWNTIYDRDRHPVVIERAFGRGSLVLSSDSFLVSNQAMRADRHAELLAWLIGSNASVLFDETHLGTVESPGIAALVRKYRLHGLVIGSVLLAGLFVWKSSVRFVPPPDEDGVESLPDAIAGRDSAAGFINLLRRSIAPSDILDVCFAEWKKARAKARTDSTGKLARAAAVVAEENAKPARERSPLENYRRISRIISEPPGLGVPAAARIDSSPPRDKLHSL